MTIQVDELKQILQASACGEGSNKCALSKISDVLIDILSLQMQTNIDPILHNDRHEWIQLQIDRERHKQERWQKVSDGVKQQVIGWTIISTIGTVLSSIGYFAYKLYTLMKTNG